MTKATILLAPIDVMANVFFSESKLTLIRGNLDRYTEAGTLEVDMDGEDAAEEMFDLTNNPSRQEEREQKYGRGRSVSSGDVILVDGKHFACMSMGWKVLA